MDNQKIIENNEIPKILVIGMTQHGKSTFIKHMIDRSIEVPKVGNGRIACTKKP